MCPTDRHFRSLVASGIGLCCVLLMAVSEVSFHKKLDYMACLPLYWDFFLLPDVLEQSLRHLCWCCRVCIEGLRGNFMALDISSVVMGLMLICSSSPASMSGGCSTGFPDRRRLKCSFQRFSWSTGLVRLPPSSPRTSLSELDLLPDSFLVISYSVIVSFLVAASCALDASWYIYCFFCLGGCFF